MTFRAGGTRFVLVTQDQWQPTLYGHDPSPPITIEDYEVVVSWVQFEVPVSSKTLKTAVGLLDASIKTFNGLAIASVKTYNTLIP